ncbi:MAG TPA: endolytic transglycosylase MltG [Solirubrobacteraceae bacterium]|nr:endolytic transglycosylase MltG [Solirubrobacteraceae bacterium]
MPRRYDRTHQTRERSAQERERDRLERERRRSSWRGETPEQHDIGVPLPPSLPDGPQLDPSPAAEQPVAGEAGVGEPGVGETVAGEPAVEEPAIAEIPTVHPSSAGSPAPLEPASVGPADLGQLSLQPSVTSPAQPPPAALARPARRSRRARLGALLALAVAIIAVVLLLSTLLRSSSHPKPPPPVPVVKVLIPEGKTRAQIAQIAAADRLSGDYRAASKRSPLLNPIRYGAPAGTPDLEGFLFPATYDMFPRAPVARLVEEQLLAFREHFGVEDIERARALHLTPYQLLIVASMVEREAQVPADRPKIAAVIYNRLRLGMPLGVDATIYYAIEQRTGIATYTRELTEAQLHIDSPYNTRTHAGLPPTPISNPGLASIEAAAHPAHVSYLYYVLAPNGCGEHVFSRTPGEFEVAAAAYHAALSRNAGHLPACKAK